MHTPLFLCEESSSSSPHLLSPHVLFLGSSERASGPVDGTVAFMVALLSFVQICPFDFFLLRSQSSALFCFPRPTFTRHLHSLWFSVLPSTDSIHLCVLKDFLLLTLLLFYHSLFPLIFSSVLFLPSSSSLCSSSLAPSPGSNGTREGVFQKNLSGLLPIRDLRLDPSLLYSLPLLALSPSLLLVWMFLSVAVLLAKLRCSWGCQRIRGPFVLSSSAGPRRHAAARRPPSTVQGQALSSPLHYKYTLSEASAFSSATTEPENRFWGRI